jgi:hypothetical protein
MKFFEITEYFEVTAFGSITFKISEISVVYFFESLNTAVEIGKICKSWKCDIHSQHLVDGQERPDSNKKA